jgi:HTH-type transcriptional regulator/antitoxin MqsA
MNVSWDNKPCPVCGEGTLHDGVRKELREYRGQSLGVIERGAYCDKCGDGIIDADPTADTAWREFKDRVDQDERTQLAAIRQKLGLTQQQAALLTGGGHNAFSRYERGEAKPVLAVLNLFRVLDRHPQLLQEFGLSAPFTSFSNVAVTPVSTSSFTVLVVGDGWVLQGGAVAAFQPWLPGRVTVPISCPPSANIATEVSVVSSLLADRPGIELDWPEGSHAPN